MTYTHVINSVFWVFTSINRLPHFGLLLPRSIDDQELNPSIVTWPSFNMQIVIT